MPDDLNTTYTTLLTMAIEHGKQLERVLQINENLEDRQDDLKQALDYLLKVINGNGDGRGGLKTVAVVHDGELIQLKKDLADIKKHHEDNADWMQTAKTYFNDRRQIGLSWRTFWFATIIQTLILAALTLVLTNGFQRFSSAPTPAVTTAPTR